MQNARFPSLAGAARRGQRGVVAIIVGLSLTAMVGFIGLALDGGRLYLAKTELQNAADACALAASYELTGAPTIPVASFERAELVGKDVGARHKVLFQGATIAGGDITVSFGTALSGSGWSAAAGAPGTSKYVRCVIERAGIAPNLMQVLGIGESTVRALATATLAPAQTTCALPMALCARGAAPSYGYLAGDWVPMGFSQSGGGGNQTANYTGNFRWIDFFPNQQTPGCSGGGAQELACLLAGAGQCSLPEPTNAACTSSGNANPTPGCVGQNGAVNSLEKGYNTRFGVYANGGGYNITTSPPDFTGNGFAIENWTLGRNAYAGSVAGQTNFRDSRAAHLAITNPAGLNPPFFANNDTIATQAQHTTNGADRRLVVLPIVECSNFSSGQHAPVRAYACVLMLDPYRRQGNNVKTQLEYIGRSNEPGSPCASSGIAGNAISQGPLVPALVQ